MTAEELLDRLREPWRAALAPKYQGRWFDKFIKDNRAEIVALLARYLDKRAADAAISPELRTPAQRTRANLKAMKILADSSPGSVLRQAERRALEQYSGWGGLSIEDNKAKFPPGLVPEAFGLIHEYFTPRVVADAIGDALCPLLPQLAGLDGVIRALEPSVGIGRLVDGFTPQRCLALEASGAVRELRWTAVELSPVSARMFVALHPEAEVHETTFERWVRDHGPAVQSTINLVISNPPYGQRGEYAADDPHPDYQERAAYAYFMRRALDLLVPGGLGVFIVPAGFLSAVKNKGLRERVLRRNHLSAAYRLPSEDTRGRNLFPGAHNVVDVIFLRSRGGELSRIDDDDEFIVKGDYFARYPEHILGREEGSWGSSDDDLTQKARRRYAVIGDFTGLPPLVERSVCSACALRNVPRLQASEQQHVMRDIAESLPDLDPALQHALSLGRRFDAYMRLRAAEDPAALGLWKELRDALLALQQLPPLAQVGGNPWLWKELRELASRKDLPSAQQLLNAFTQGGQLALAIAEEPQIERKFKGRSEDVVAQAEHLFRAQRRLTVDQLMAFHRAQGGDLDREKTLATLFAAEWCVDGPDWDDLLPMSAYLMGRLWPRHDHAAPRAAAGDAQARRQLERLLVAMKLALFEDIQDYSPRQRWVPLALLGAWLGDTLNRAYGPVPLEWSAGLVQVGAVDYNAMRAGEQGERHGVTVLAPETLWCLGWLNHDLYLFKPELTEDEQKRAEAELRVKPDEDEAATEDGDDDEASEERSKLALAREFKALMWERSFRQWIESEDARRALITDAYNRAFRGTVVPTYDTAPLEVARWGAKAPRPRPHQTAGARRVLDLRGGLIAYDVGVGKTYTAIVVVARARQEGWVRRPVIIVPSSLIWKWHDDFQCTLPDYRIVVIGSNRKRISRGDRKGLLTSDTDTPEDRARKWTEFQAGQYDVAILSYDAMPRTRLNEDAVFEHVNQISAIRRMIKLRQRNLQNRKSKDDLSERDRAILKHGVRAFVRQMLELPKGHKFDPGVAWDDLGIDMLVVDEAASFKNLYKPEPREHGLPKFMGGSGEGAKRAWQFEFRAAAVRRHTGGTGIVLLSATPAKNSPLEFYNLIQYVDPLAFTGRGLIDPEQFIDRFLRIETMEVMDVALGAKMGSAVTGFKNLDDLRAILMNYAEFRSGAEVGLTLPKPDVRQVRVPMNEAQEEKYEKIVARIQKLMDVTARGEEVAERVRFKILGLVQQLSQIALHPQLNEGYDFHNALSGGVVETKGEGDEVTERALVKPDYASPKLLACAERVVSSPGCGHIIFCESTAAQVWMREVLVAKGVPRERIAILNAIVSTPADRTRIAREFNGLSGEPPPPGTCGGGSDRKGEPKYDVLIVNIVGQEGIDLQVRTCAIHHLDLPWTPADLEQRNGRAVRQGNTLEVVQIFYYLSDRSMDWYRYSLLEGKRSWLVSLLDNQVRDTNNPGAQENFSTEDILLIVSRDEAATRAMLEQRREARRRLSLLKMAQEAATLLTQASARFRDARETADPLRAAKLRADGETRLADLQRVSPEAWPWAKWSGAAREVEMIVPPGGGAPVFEGLRVRLGAGQLPVVGGRRPVVVEFGAVVHEESSVAIGVRAAGDPAWTLVYPVTLESFNLTPDDLGVALEEDEAALRDAIEVHIELHLGRDDGHWKTVGLRGASDAWVTRWWTAIEPAVKAGLAARKTEHPPLPVVVDGRLSLRTGAEIRAGELIPPTSAGWQMFLQLAPTSGEKYTPLRSLAAMYFARKIPRDLLSRQQQAEAAEGPAAGVEAAIAVEEAVTPTPAAEPVASDRAPAVVVPLSPPRPEPEPPVDTRGHVYRLGAKWHVDSAFIRALPNAEHVGFGDFEVVFPEGRLTITRITDAAPLPKQSGRLHELYHSGGAEALDALIERLVAEGRVEIVSTSAPPAARPAPAAADLPRASFLPPGLEAVL